MRVAPLIVPNWLRQAAAAALLVAGGVSLFLIARSSEHPAPTPIDSVASEVGGEDLEAPEEPEVQLARLDESCMELRSGKVRLLLVASTPSPTPSSTDLDPSKEKAGER